MRTRVSKRNLLYGEVLTDNVQASVVVTRTKGLLIRLNSSETFCFSTTGQISHELLLL
jgi:hypothetical protein